MKGIAAAYWHKDGLEIYRLAGKKPVKCAAGRLEELRPVRVGLGKKVLIVGRDILLHARKKYPPASKEKLFKAVALEIGELFPLSKPAFHCRVFESGETYALVDIWAWESGQYGRIREVFPFNYVVPEDLAFAAAVPEVKIFQRGGTSSMLAHAGGKFLAGASFAASGFNDEQVERFLHGLEQYGAEIRGVKIYGPLPIALKGVAVSRAAGSGHPPCLDEIGSLDLAEFKRGDGINLREKKDLLFRIAVYLVLGYALMQYLTLINYDHAANEIRQKLAAMDRKAAGLAAGPATEDYGDLFREVEEKVKAAHSPLKLMNFLAGKLPEGTFLNRMSLNENNVELAVSSPDPLAVLKALGEGAGIRKVGLKGAIVQDAASKSNNFTVVIELGR